MRPSPPIRLTDEADRLLGVELSEEPCDETGHRALARAIGRGIAQGIEAPGYAFDRGATRELIARLCSDRERPYESFVTDLAEILFLERERRSEYMSHEGGAPPWRFPKLMLEYAVKARRIDEILGALTKGFCAAECDRLPVGCCSIPGYDMGLVPDSMLELQEIEARRHGWIAPASEDKCKFHGAAGCVLRLFKSPACIGMLCDPLVAFLRQRQEALLLDAFLERLAAFRNRDIDRTSVFEAMDAVIVSGVRLLAPRATCTCRPSRC